MHRTKLCLSLAAGLALTALAPFAALAAQGDSNNPSAWRFRTYRPPAEPQSLTVGGARGHGWFEATDSTGNKVRVSLPPRFGWIERDGKMVSTAALHTGDVVQVWGMAEGRRLNVARAEVVGTNQTAAQSIRLVSAGCCSACAACTNCDTQCAGCTSRADCQNCCGASCCPSAACCA